MAHGPVNLIKATSAMGRGPIHKDDGESPHRLEDDAQVNIRGRITGTCTTEKTSDAQRVTEHRCNHSEGIQTHDDAQGSRQQRASARVQDAGDREYVMRRMDARGASR